MATKIDKFVIEFSQKALDVVKDYDSNIHHNFKNSLYKKFYKYDNKGIFVYSITEPILKFLIFTELCKEYQIWPEGTFYEDSRKLLDFALFYKEIEDIDVEIEPEIAIEMKWGGIRTDGTFYSWSMHNLIADIEKLYNNSNVSNKYLMQFVALDKTKTKINKTVLKTQLQSNIDGRSLKGKEKIELIYSNYFKAKGCNLNFTIVLWKMGASKK